MPFYTHSYIARTFVSQLPLQTRGEIEVIAHQYAITLRGYDPDSPIEESLIVIGLATASWLVASVIRMNKKIEEIESRGTYRV